MKAIIKMLCIITVLATQSLASSAQITHSCSFQHDNWKRNVVEVKGEALTSLQSEDFYCSTLAGQPMLPSKRLKFVVPENAADFKVVITDSVTSDIAVTCPIQPKPKTVFRNSVEKDAELYFDRAVYENDAFFPASPVIISGEGYYMGENHIISLEVFPMRYNPVSGTIRQYTDVSFTISYTTSGNKNRDAIVRNSIEKRAESLQELKELVENDDQIAEFSHGDSQTRIILPPDSAIDIGGGITPIQLYDKYRYMIIVTDSLKDSMRRLVALKRQKGYSVGIKTLSEVLSDSTVQDGDARPLGSGTTYINDDAGKLRAFLRNAYTNNETEYVLFAGKDIPYRKGYLQRENNTITPYLSSTDNIPTDWYFCDLNTNWNINNNLYFGENEKYNLYPFDMNPELFVGRLMFENQCDIRNYTNKLLRYELNPGNGDTSYLGRVLEASNGNIAPKLDEAYAEYMRRKWNTAFPQADLHYIEKDSVSPDAHDLIAHVENTKYGMICIEGHGNPENIFTNDLGEFKYCIFPYDNMVPNNHYSSWEQISCTYKPSILYTIACATTPFDNWNEYDYQNFLLKSYNLRHLGNSFTLGEKYGGVAYIGYTRPCSTGDSISESPLLAQYFIDCLNEGKYNIGKAEAFSKMYFTEGINKDALGNNLIGDPEMEVWTTTLSPMNGIIVQRYNNSIRISGLNSDGGESIVSYCNNTKQGYVSTSDNTVTLSDTNPNSVIMIRRHDKLPFIAPLLLQNTYITKSQYVIARNIYAGFNVDNNRNTGNVIIKNGADYEVEFTDSVNLMPGFEVKAGASFSADPSQY